jgi:hypothetical protein
MHVQRVHENKKSFKCDLCSFSAFQLTALKKTHWMCSWKSQATLM